MNPWFRIRAAFVSAIAVACFGLQFASPVRAVDCYPPGSCSTEPTTTYETVQPVDLSVGTAAAVQCIGTTCTPVEVKKTVTSSGVTLTLGSGVVLQLKSLSGGGTPTQVGDDGTLVIPATGGFTITLSGLTPGSFVDVYFNSDRIFIGKAKVGADGKVNATLPIPSNVPTGNHTAQILATDYTGRTVSVALGIVVSGAVPTGASRFVINNAVPAATATVFRGAKVQLRAGLFGVAAGKRATVATTSKLATCSTKVTVKTSGGKTLLAPTCMVYSKKDGKAEYTWTVGKAYKGRAKAIFTFKETGRAASSLIRTFIIG